MPRSLSPSPAEAIRPDELDGLFAPLLDGGRPDLSALAVALAVSGGSDSTALMVLFAEWLRRAGREPSRHTVLTVDHGLRAQSAAEAQGCRRAGPRAWLPARHAGCGTAQAAGRRPGRRTGGALPPDGRLHARARHPAAAHGAHARRPGRDAADAPGARQRTRRAHRHGAAAPTSPKSRPIMPLEPGELALARPLLDVPKARLVPPSRLAASPGWRTRAICRRLRALAAACGASTARRPGAHGRHAGIQRGDACGGLAQPSRRPSRGSASRSPAPSTSIPAAMSRSIAAGCCAVEAEIALRVLGRAIAAAGGCGSAGAPGQTRSDRRGSAFRRSGRDCQMDLGARHDHRQGRRPHHRTRARPRAAASINYWRGREGPLGRPLPGRASAQISPAALSRCARWAAPRRADCCWRRDADASRAPAGIAAMVPCFRRGDRLHRGAAPEPLGQPVVAAPT